jgi:hypothetical protein
MCVQLGSINQQNKKEVAAAVSALLKEFNIAPNRMYINFFDAAASSIGHEEETVPINVSEFLQPINRGFS